MLRNVTLSAEERLIRKAREKAQREKRSFNAVFREWLVRYTNHGNGAKDYKNLMRRLAYAAPGRRFSREEANAR